MIPWTRGFLCSHNTPAHFPAHRTGAPRGWRFPGIDARNLGFAYPSSLVRDDTLFVLYSIGKEDIGITEVPLRSLGL
jgi:hypothetical protein